MLAFNETNTFEWLDRVWNVINVSQVFICTHSVVVVWFFVSLFLVNKHTSVLV